MRYTNLKAFEKHLENSSPNHFADIYMLLCKDDFERKEAIDCLIGKMLKTQNNNEHSLTVLEGNQLVLENLMNELNTLSLFSPKKILLINQADKIEKSILEKLEEYFIHPSPLIVLIISASSISHSTNFYKKAEKHGIVLDIPEEKSWEKEKLRKEWVFSKVASEGKKIDPLACQLILKQVGTDSALLSQEIEKLFCFIGDRKEITPRDVESVCSNESQENIWQLGESIFRRDGNTSLRITKGMLEDGVALLSLIRQIRTQFQTEFQVCSLLTAGGNGTDVMKLFPYMKGQILERHMHAAQNYGMARFKKGMLEIDNTELLAKNSSVDPSLLAEMLIIKLVT